MSYPDLEKFPQRKDIVRSFPTIGINDSPQNGWMPLRILLIKKLSLPRVALLMDYLRKFSKEGWTKLNHR